MGRGLSPLEKRILEWLSGNKPADNGSRDFNWCRHPAFRGKCGRASAPTLSRALRRLEARGLIARSWSGSDHSGHVRVELIRDPPAKSIGIAADAEGGATA